jgi:hypothetical protein
MAASNPKDPHNDPVSELLNADPYHQAFPSRKPLALGNSNYPPKLSRVPFLTSPGLVSTDFDSRRWDILCKVRVVVHVSHLFMLQSSQKCYSQAVFAIKYNTNVLVIRLLHNPSEVGSVQACPVQVAMWESPQAHLWRPVTCLDSTRCLCT